MPRATAGEAHFEEINDELIIATQAVVWRPPGGLNRFLCLGLRASFEEFELDISAFYLMPSFDAVAFEASHRQLKLQICAVCTCI